MSSIDALSGIEDVKEKLCNLSKDLDKYAPEHRNQVMVDRLRQQKLRAMISLAKAQQFLAETDVLIADYNLQAVADEFEHMKKERFDNTDMKPSQNSGSKEEKTVASREYPTNSSKPSDICCTPLLPAEGNPKSKEKGTELIPKHNTHTEAHRSKSKIDAGYKINDSERMNKINEKSRVTGTSSKTHEPTSKTYKESSSKTKETATSKAHEPSSSKTKETATSKAHEPSSSKTKETATSKAHEPSSSKTKETATSKSSSSSKTKEAVTSKTYEAVKSAKEAALADTDLPAPGLKRKKRNRSKSKSKESKRHKSSHATTEVTAPTASSNGPTASLNVPTASSNVPTASSNVPTASSNVPTASVGSAATSKVLSRASATALSDMPTSSHVSYLFAHAPNCDCPKIYQTNKEKTLLNTSISPIKKIVEHKRVQTDQKKFKNDIVQTDEVKKVTKGVQTDNVIILQVGGEPVVENSPFTDEDTLLLDTLPALHSHTTAISLAKAFQQIKSEKTPAERQSPSECDVSEVLTRNELFQTTELMMEDEAESEGTARAVKAEVDEELASTSTELLVNDLYKDIMKAKDKERDLKPKRRVTRRALWKVLDMC